MSKPEIPDADNVFVKIINKEIPAEILYEDEQCLAFKDKFPVSPEHFLVIPKKQISSLSKSEETDKELLGHLMWIVNKLAKERELEEGYRVVINDGKHGCQTVNHLHIHVIGKKQLGWPPG
eukprot:GAHX01000431.1.p1 GENE.GAHX01000431.1~~GAHX01000431.1.p1  ORF type:complete len:121 (-),score=26.72 GAHX01000431.1:161-523(-)